MQYLPVKTKRDFTRRYQLGEFGNASPSWSEFGDFYWRTNWEQHRYGLYHLRNGSVAGGITHYKQSWLNAVDLWRNKSNLTDWYVSEQVPLEVERTLLIQGELMETETGLYLFYSTVPKPMRDALRERAESVSGIIVGYLLQYYLDPGDHDWLMELLRRYPGHVVEFSAFRRRWGTLMRRTIVWEVRRY